MDEIGNQIRHKIEELRTLIRAADRCRQDSPELRELELRLQKISEASDQIKALHSALVRQRRRESERETFFKRFSTLSQRQIDKLVSTTHDWDLSPVEIACLEEYATDWIQHPQHFYDPPAFDRNSAGSLYHYLSWSIDVEPIRQRIAFIDLSDLVDAEQQKAFGRIRRTTSPSDSLTRDRALLRAGIRSAAQSVQKSPLSGNVKFQTDRLRTFSRYGFKWKMIEPRAMVMGINRGDKRIQRYSWKACEIEALNAYIKTLPQYQIVDVLERAWDSIARRPSGHATVSHAEPRCLPAVAPPPANNEMLQGSGGMGMGQEAHGSPVESGRRVDSLFAPSLTNTFDHAEFHCPPNLARTSHYDSWGGLIALQVDPLHCTSWDPDPFLDPTMLGGQ